MSCFSIDPAVEGTSDDLDVPIKAVFGDRAFVKEHNLCSINSINWARILVQAGHFVYAYYQMVANPGQEEEVEVVIPTGACGNITGAGDSIQSVNSCEKVKKSVYLAELTMHYDCKCYDGSDCKTSLIFNQVQVGYEPASFTLRDSRSTTLELREVHGRGLGAMG